MTKTQMKKLLKQKYDFTVSLKAKKTTFISILLMAMHQDETSDVVVYDDIYNYMKNGGFNA